MAITISTLETQLEAAATAITAGNWATAKLQIANASTSLAFLAQRSGSGAKSMDLNKINDAIDGMKKAIAEAEEAARSADRGGGFVHTTLNR